MKRRNSAGKYAPDVQDLVEAACRQNSEIVATAELYEKLGHGPRNPIKVMRAFCLDCMGEQPSMVRKCTSVGCDLWPFRLGSNPFRKPQTHGFGREKAAQ